tara:strand:- start:1585 stop:1863 length:279 start_codon:yes stop_codon:yes gene_type:complete
MYDIEVPTEKELRRNVLGQGVKILHALMRHYSSGSIEVPEHNDVFMGLMVLLCEGKIKGEYTDDGEVRWVMTEKKEANYGNVIRFPLTKGVE